MAEVITFPWQTFSQSTPNTLTLAAESISAASQVSNDSPLLSPEVKKIDVAIAQHQAKISTLLMQVNGQAPKNSETVILLLEAALTKLFRVAVAVRDSATLFSGVAPELSDMLKQIERAFGAAEQQAKHYIEDYSQAQKALLLPMSDSWNYKERVSELKDQNRSQSEDNGRHMMNENGRLEREHQSQQDSMGQIRALEQQMQSVDPAGMMFSPWLYLISPMAYLMVHNANTPIGKWREDHEKATREYKEKEKQIDAILDRMKELRQQATSLQAEGTFLDALPNILTRFDAQIQNAQAQIIVAMKTMSGLDQVTSHLKYCVATMTEEPSTSIPKEHAKHRVVLILLQICDIALIHPRLRDECQQISEELIRGYGDQAVPSNIGSFYAELHAKLQQVK